MKEFFDSAERIERLREVARSWLGTPWCANAASKGIGVSCHNGPRAILIEAGALAEEFPVVWGDHNHSSRALGAKSVMEPWLDARPEFVKVAGFVTSSPTERTIFDWSLGMLRPGDLLGLQVYHCLDHLGVVLGVEKQGDFIHTLGGKHTCLDHINIPPYQQMIKAVWRPVA